MQNEAKDQIQAPAETEMSTPLPSLASVFNPEEFFEMDAVDEVSLSRICCGSE
jgi:hypothetical protein